MRDVVRIPKRPHIFPNFAKLAVAYDVHEFEVWIEKNLVEGNVVGVLNCIPFARAAQYGIKTTNCVELQTKMFDIVFEYMIDAKVPVSRRGHIQV